MCWLLNGRAWNCITRGTNKCRRIGFTFSHIFLGRHWCVGSYRDVLLRPTLRWTRSSPHRWGSCGSHSSVRSLLLMAAAGAKGNNTLSCFLYSRCLGVSLSRASPEAVVVSLSIDPRAWASWRRAPVFIQRSQTLWRHEEVDHTTEPIGGGAYCNQECFGGWQSTNVLC